MKSELKTAKAALISFIFLTLIASAFGAVQTTKDNQPTITLTFNEYAIVNNVRFACCNADNFPTVGATYVDATWSIESGDIYKDVASKRFAFTPDGPLPNGVNWLVVNATDLAGNERIFSDYKFAVNGSSPKIVLAQRGDTPLIYFANSSYHAVSKEKTFNITANIYSLTGQLISGQCRYTDIEGAPLDFSSPLYSPFTNTNGNDNILSYTMPSELVRPNTYDKRYSKPITILCKGSDNLLSNAKASLYVDNTNPKLVDTNLNPQIITEYIGGELKTNITITADKNPDPEEIMCKYQIGSGTITPFSSYNISNFNAYKNVINEKIVVSEYSSRTQLNLSITCHDRAGNYAAQEQRALIVDLTAPLSISMISPKAGFTNKGQVPISLTTNRRAVCQYFANTTSSTPITLGQVDNINHKTPSTLSLSDGQYIYTFACNALTAGIAEARVTVAFTVDTKAPDNIKVNGSTVFCKNDEIVFPVSLKLSANDSASGVDHFEYQVKSSAGALLLNNTRSDGTIISVLKTINDSKFNFSSGSTATFKIFAVDKAGNPSTTPIDYVVTYNPVASACLGYVCGNNICESGENVTSCKQDCIDCSSNGVCNSECRSYNKTDADCAAITIPRCGDGICQTNETNTTCAADCTQRQIVCNSNSICDSNEGCSCIDCDGEKATCQNGQVCDFDAEVCVKEQCPSGQTRCSDGLCKASCLSLNASADKKTTATKDTSSLPLILIIIGFILTAGGAGYLFYKKQHPSPKQEGGQQFAGQRSQGDGPQMPGQPQFGQRIESLSPERQRELEEKSKLLYKRRQALRDKKEGQRLEIFKGFGTPKAKISLTPAQDKKLSQKKGEIEEVTTEGWISLQELNNKLAINTESQIGKDKKQTISPQEFKKLTDFVDKRKEIEKEVASTKELKAQDQEIFDKLSKFVEDKQKEAKGTGFSKEIILSAQEKKLLDEISRKSEDLFDSLPKPKKEYAGSEFEELSKLGETGGSRDDDEDVYSDLKKRINNLDNDDFSGLEELEKEDIKSKTTSTKKRKFDIPEELKAMAKEPQKKNNGNGKTDSKDTNSKNNKKK